MVIKAKKLKIVKEVIVCTDVLVCLLSLNASLSPDYETHFLAPLCGDSYGRIVQG